LRRAWILIFFLAITSKINAQDALFSQQFLLPTLVNPSTAGNGRSFRAGINYRNQWRSVSEPFNTIAASFDTNLAPSNRGRDADKKGLGLGLNLVRDKTGDPELTTLIAETLISYRVQLTKESTLAGGLSVAYDQRSVNPADGKWASQFNGVFYDPGLASGESFAGDSESHLDFGAGISYELVRPPRGRKKKQPLVVRGGISAFHLGRIALTDSQLLTQDIGIRLSGYFNSELGISEMNAIVPTVFAHYQGGASKIIAGAYFKQVLVTGSSFISDIKESALYAGLFYEPNRAVIVKGFVEYGAYTIGLAYDIDLSEVEEFGSSSRAFELNLMYQWNRKRR